MQRLEAIQRTLDRQIEQHGRSRGQQDVQHEQNRASFDRLDGAIERLVEVLAANEPRTKDRLVLWLVVAVIGASMGSKAIELFAHVLGLPR